MARIKFKTLVLAFRAVKRSAPAYFQKIIRLYTPARLLRSATAGHLCLPLSVLPPPGQDYCLFWLHDGGMISL